MGWHGLPSFDGISRVSDGVKMVIAVFGAAIMMTVVIVVVIIAILGLVDVLSRPKGGGEYRRHGPGGGVGTGSSRPGTKTAGGCSQFAKSSCGVI